MRPDDYRKLNGVLRYSRGDTPQRVLADRHGLLGRLGLDRPGARPGHRQRPDLPVRPRSMPSDQGATNRQSLSADFQRSSGPSSLRATAFVLRNSLNLFSNFTYFLDDPENGDQFEQAERRVAAGGRVTYRRLGHLFERHTESAIGVQVRRDWLSTGRASIARPGTQRLSTTREDTVGQTMTGVYAQTEIEWTRTLRTTLGLRADVVPVRCHVRQPARTPATAPTRWSARSSPRCSAPGRAPRSTPTPAWAFTATTPAAPRSPWIPSAASRPTASRRSCAPGAPRSGFARYGCAALQSTRRALVSRARLRAAVRRRRRHDRRRPAEPPRGSRVDATTRGSRRG